MVTVWLISMALGWESFVWPQLLGFCVLLAGVLVYNRAVTLPRRFEPRGSAAIESGIEAPVCARSPAR